ncbi:MAG: hypothetical protein WEB06_03125 [Actinomycetota bacterium]
MAASKRGTKKKSPTKRRPSKFVCPECGFKAAHAMGLGRHRTSRHGVPSQRELAGRRRGSRSGGDARLVKRINMLEKRYERLVKGLRKALADSAR